MSTIKVRPDARVWRRLLNIGFKKSLTKSLAELITNSDDSYKEKYKNENGGKEQSSNPLISGVFELNIGDTLDQNNFKLNSSEVKKDKIIIKCFRSRNAKMQIFDMAEGISHEDMEKKFEKFGKDQGRFVEGRRGLFGQGLMQVLFSHRKGNLLSIKNDNAAKAIFAIGKGDAGDLEIKTNNIGHARRELRHNSGLEKGNGTVVEFILNDECKLPQGQQLISKLSNFYILRSIASDPLREVVLEQYKGKDIIQKSNIKYTIPTGEVIYKNNVQFNFESYSEISGELIILKHEAGLSQSGKEDREGGLLVIDDNDSVYDLTFFDYERNPYIDRLFGILRLHGARQVIKDKLDKGEAILTDSRDGFDDRNPFYRALADALTPHLKEVIDKEAEIRKEEEGELSPEIQKRHREAFEELNKLYKEITGELPKSGEEPTPTKIPDYIEFDRQSIKLMVNTMHRVLLNVNVDKVENNQIINILSSDEKIKVTPNEIKIDLKDQKNGIISHSVFIESDVEGSMGNVTAQTSGISGLGEDSISVIVVPQNFHIPLNGLEFNPKYSTSTSDKNGTLYLYINTEQIPVGSEIKLTSNNEVIILDIMSIILSEKDIIKGTYIAQKKIIFRGSGIGQRAIIKAEIADKNGIIFFDEAEVYIVSQRKRPLPPGTGRYSRTVYQPLDRQVQSFFNPDNGEIIVNSNHPINKRYFGKDTIDFKNSIEKELHSQVLLAELVLSECLFEAVSKAYHAGKYLGKVDPATDIRNYVEEKKYSIGDRIHKLFVTGSIT